MMSISRIPKHSPETMKILSTLCLLLGVIATGPGIAYAQKTEALDAGKLDQLAQFGQRRAIAKHISCSLDTRFQAVCHASDINRSAGIQQHNVARRAWLILQHG